MKLEEDGERHRKRVKTYNVPGHVHFLTFSCYRRMPLLTNDAWRSWLADAITAACGEHDMALWAYVFMPEHVHLLVKPRRAKYDMSAFRKRIKQSSAKRIINSLKNQNTSMLKRLAVDERPGKRCFRFWQEGPGYDKNIWCIEKALEKAVYCHMNPAIRKLVKSPGQWRWSSFRWLEQGKRDGEPIPLSLWDERLRDDLGGPALAAYNRSQWHQFIKRTARP